MAFKVSKVQAAQLFQYVRKLSFRFDPFATDARPIREMWRQVERPRGRNYAPRGGGPDARRGAAFVDQFWAESVATRPRPVTTARGSGPDESHCARRGRRVRR